MGKDIKLTPAQLTLLGEQQGQFVYTYKPGLRLKELGLIDCRESYGVVSWSISEAGKDFLVWVSAKSDCSDFERKTSENN